MSSWIFYRTPAGKDIVSAEIKRARLTRPQTLKLEKTMDRVAGGRTMRDDVRSLGGGLFEVKAQLDGRAMRVLFAYVKGQPLLLALRFIDKKSQKTPQNDLETARTRLTDWQQRNPPA